MEILIFAIIGYFLYGAYLILRDFGLSHPDSGQWHNAPMYVFKPNLRSLVFALFMRPLSANNVHLFFPTPAKMKFFGIIKLLLKVGIIGFILYFVIGLFS